MSSVFGHWDAAGCGLRASRLGVTVVLKCRLQTLCRASRLRRGTWALCLSTEVVLTRGLWFLRLGIAVGLRCGLRALHLGSARVALISLASEAWTLLSYDLSSVIFRQSRAFPQQNEDRVFNNSRPCLKICVLPRSEGYTPPASWRTQGRISPQFRGHVLPSIQGCVPSIIQRISKL